MLFDGPNLFARPVATAAAATVEPLIVRPTGQVGIGDPCRMYQLEAADAIAAARNAGYRRPLCVHATGLGKGKMIAEVAARLQDGGKIMVLVDSKTLVHQLADAIHRHTGRAVGRIADGVMQGTTRWCVVATVQAMYTPDRHGKALVEYELWDGVRTVLLDECESFLAPRYRSVPEHLLSRADTFCAGFTATPCRGDKTPMTNFFDYQAAEEGPLLRTVEWGIANGWLVDKDQTFVRANVDTSTLKIVQHKDGTTDISSQQTIKMIAELAARERDFIEFAKGIVEVAGKRPGLIYAPPSVKAAQAVCHYCNAIQHGICDVVWGERRDGDAVIERAQAGDVQLLASVNQLTKGLDHPSASFAAILRLTTVYRLYVQMVGRVLRPHGSIMRALTDAASTEQRLRIIAESPKPRALIADLVGTGEDLRTMQLVDMVATDRPPEVRERAKAIMLKRHREGAPPQAPRQVIEEATQQIAAEQKRKLAEQERLRSMIRIDGEVHVYGAAGDAGPQMPAAKPKKPASEKQVNLFVALAHNFTPQKAYEFATSRDVAVISGMIGRYKKEGNQADYSRVREAKRAPEAAPQRDPRDDLRNYNVPERVVSTMTMQQATKLALELTRRAERGLCGWHQAERLRSAGYTKAEVHNMTRAHATRALEAARANGGRRPGDVSHLVGATEGVL